MDDNVAPPSAKPGRYRGIGAEMLRGIGVAYLRLGGWKMEGDWPPLAIKDAGSNKNSCVIESIQEAPAPNCNLNCWAY